MDAKFYKFNQQIKIKFRNQKLNIKNFPQISKIIKSSIFPKKFHKNKNYKYKAVFGIGGNIGDCEKRFKKLIRFFLNERRFLINKTSKIIKNKAFGYTKQNDFLNSAVLLQTSLDAKTLLKIMLNYEKKFKRKRSFKNAPRTLDLDFLLFSGRNYNSKRLILPHFGIFSRPSVIFPLKDLDFINI